ncbi:hypothetical protein EYF80_033684 [Liparis tanakae]|uniref:Secreted protein n=1 Tax=Liparis tanakae TaxID=230148 RepID=A0A4Z2GU47_9TELE|nr:hypothetical protein EYF80_033684 [Liparis tanakae]
MTMVMMVMIVVMVVMMVMMRGARGMQRDMTSLLHLLHQKESVPPSSSSSSPLSDYQEVKKGRLQWKVCVKALPSVTTRPCPPERLRSTTTRGICTSWMGLFPSFSAWVRFNTLGGEERGSQRSWTKFMSDRRDSTRSLVSWEKATLA